MAESTPAHTRDWNVKTVAGLVGSVALAVGLLAFLAAADGQMFEDAEFSSLYRFTLNDAYSRFSASDKQVPAGGAPIDPLDDLMAGRNAAGQPVQPGQVPGGLADKLRRLQGGGVGQAGVPGRAAGQGAQPQYVQDDGGPHMKKGSELLSTGQYEQAAAEFRLAIQENPRRTLAQHSLGDALRMLGRPDEAIAAYRKVLEINPAYYCCYIHIGDVEKARQNTAAAKQAYDSAIAAYKQQLSQGGAGAAIARYYLAKLYGDQNENLSEALAMAEQAVAESPDQIAYVQLLAQLYEKVGRTQDAVATYDKLIQLSPQHAESFRLQQQRLTQPASGSSPP